MVNIVLHFNTNLNKLDLENSYNFFFNFFSLMDVDFAEMYSILTFRGLHRFAYKYFSNCIYEVMRSVSSKVLLKELQMFMPTLTLRDITPYVLYSILFSFI